MNKNLIEDVDESLSDYFKDEIDSISNFVKINNTSYIEDMNSPFYRCGNEDNKVAIFTATINADIKSKETVSNMKNTTKIISGLEEIYDLYEKELQLGGIRNYEDFESIMLTDHSVLRMLEIPSWVISDIIRTYERLDYKDTLGMVLHLCIPIKDYTDIMDYDFTPRKNSKEQGDFVKKFEDCNLYAMCGISVWTEGGDMSITDDDFFIRKVGTVRKHDIKGFIKSCLDYYNLK